MPIVCVPADPAGRTKVLDDLAARLERAEIVVLPTDTVYGLVGLAARPDALDALRALKGRPDEVPIAVLVADATQGLALAADVSSPARRAIERWWPGPLTVVVCALPDAPKLAADGTIGVRCPDDDVVRALAGRVGPLAATSANVHGEPTATSAAEAAAVFGGLLVVDGGTLAGTASTVLDCTQSPPIVLRPGPLDPAALAAVLDGT